MLINRSPAPLNQVTPSTASPASSLDSPVSASRNIIGCHGSPSSPKPASTPNVFLSNPTAHVYHQPGINHISSCVDPDYDNTSNATTANSISSTCIQLSTTPPGTRADCPPSSGSQTRTSPRPYSLSVDQHSKAFVHCSGKYSRPCHSVPPSLDAASSLNRCLDHNSNKQGAWPPHGTPPPPLPPFGHDLPTDMRVSRATVQPPAIYVHGASPDTVGSPTCSSSSCSSSIAAASSSSSSTSSTPLQLRSPTRRLSERHRPFPLILSHESSEDGLHPTAANAAAVEVGASFSPSMFLSSAGPLSAALSATRGPGGSGAISNIVTPLLMSPLQSGLLLRTRGFLDAYSETTQCFIKK